MKDGFLVGLVAGLGLLALSFWASYTENFAAIVRKSFKPVTNSPTVVKKVIIERGSRLGFIATREAVYNVTRQRIASVCKKYGEKLKRRAKLASTMVFDTRHKLGYCRHGKVESNICQKCPSVAKSPF